MDGQHTESEIRFSVLGFSQYVATLKSLRAEFLGVTQQEDQYYKVTGLENEPDRPGSIIYRLRYEPDSQLYTLTKKLSTRQAGSWKETEIGAIDICLGALIKEILDSGLSRTIAISKTRSRYRVGNCTVCLDDIVSLGKYIEIEFLGPIAPNSALRKIVHSLQLNWEDRTTDGYVSLMKAQDTRRERR